MKSLERRIAVLECPDGAIYIDDPGAIPIAERDAIIAAERKKHPGRIVWFAYPRPGPGEWPNLDVNIFVPG